MTSFISGAQRMASTSRCGRLGFFGATRSCQVQAMPFPRTSKASDPGREASTTSGNDRAIFLVVSALTMAKE